MQGPKNIVTVCLMLGYYLLSLGANFCFKEGGTDSAHRVVYFIAGNTFGISSTALLMGVYARMQINVAMVLATSGAFFLTQVAYWIVYHTPLGLAQCLGILLVGIGTALATKSASADTPVADAAAEHEGALRC